MQFPRLVLIGFLLTLTQLVGAQEFIDFQKTDFIPVSQVTVKVFAAENSHIANVDMIPIPRNPPVWEGHPNPIGDVNIPLEYLDGRRFLIWASSGKLAAFLVLGQADMKIKRKMTLVLRRYRPLEIITKTKTGKPAEHIPVFAVDAIALASHHLS